LGGTREGWLRSGKWDTGRPRRSRSLSEKLRGTSLLRGGGGNGNVVWRSSLEGRKASGRENDPKDIQRGLGGTKLRGVRQRRFRLGLVRGKGRERGANRGKQQQKVYSVRNRHDQKEGKYLCEKGHPPTEVRARTLLLFTGSKGG